MMKKTILTLVATAAMTLSFGNTALAEGPAPSPYSMRGYGLLGDRATSTQRAMGGVGYAMRSSKQINAMNPASYAAIDTMTFLFDIGLDVGSVRLSENGNSDNRTIGGLDYITMQVPLGRYMGASLGLVPISSVNYSFGSEVSNGENQYQGSGGLNELYLGVAGRPFKGFSIGANVGYVFGTLLHDTYAEATDGTSLYEGEIVVRDYSLTFGAQYSLQLNKRNRLTAGLTYGLGKDMHGHCYGVTYNQISSTTSSQQNDTIGYSKLNPGFSMPETWGAGLSYEFDNRLSLEADFTYQPWSKAKYAGISDFAPSQTFVDRYRGALGVQFTPRARGNYFKRITYRAGAFLCRDYMTYGEGNKVKEYGVTVGLGLPTPVRTTVNLGFEYKHRTTSPVKMVTENYFLVTLGISLNEAWFMPSKIF
jgi:hypothetical protein